MLRKLTVDISPDDWHYRLSWHSSYRPAWKRSDTYLGGPFWQAPYLSQNSDGKAKYPLIWLASALARLISKMTRLQKLIFYVPSGSPTGVFASELQKCNVFLPNVTTLVTVPDNSFLIAHCPNISAISTSHLGGEVSRFFEAAQTATMLTHLTIKQCVADYLGMDISPYIP